MSTDKPMSNAERERRLSVIGTHAKQVNRDLHDCPKWAVHDMVATLGAKGKLPEPLPSDAQHTQKSIAAPVTGKTVLTSALAAVRATRSMVERVDRLERRARS